MAVDVIDRELQVGFVLELGQRFHTDQRNTVRAKVVVVFDLVEMPFMFPLVAFDVTLHDGFDIDEDARTADI